MIISIGNDHAGTHHKKQVQLTLESKGIKVINHGTDSDESVDYPDLAHPVAEDVKSNKAEIDVEITPTSNSAHKEIGSNI